jgi:mRNA interferase RelE/StbE
MNWIVLTMPAFLKQLARLQKSTRRRVESFVFNELPSAENPYAIQGVEKLTGHKQFYKVRFGSYRLGLRIDKDNRQVIVHCVLHRRDIYRHFP